MTKEAWLINLENVVHEVAQRLGASSVEFVLRKYNASSIDDLSELDYPAVWDELSFMADDD